MTWREWLIVLASVPVAMAMGIAAGGLVLYLMGVDVRWWWEPR